MSFSATDVKDLREKTGAGMMDCKKALTETNGDMEGAIEYLKKQGLAKAVKKGDRIAAEGLIFSAVKEGVAALIELNCETDFVSRNDDFLALGQKVADAVLSANATTTEQALALPFEGTTVEQTISASVAKIGEKLTLRRICLVTAQKGGKVVVYNHAGGRICVAVEVTGNVAEENCRDVAMHIAAMSPQYIYATEVPADVIAKERDVQWELLKQSGKPEAMFDKILVGKMDKFASEISLTGQVFVKDPSGKKTVADCLKEWDATAVVAQFTRYAVGEGIEKKKDDFADEVKKMVG